MWRKHLQSPRIRLYHDTYLLLGREVVHDVEELADLLGRLALDHIRHSLAANVAGWVASRSVPPDTPTKMNAGPRKAQVLTGGA